MWKRVTGLAVGMGVCAAAVAGAQPAFRTAPIETIFGSAVGKAAADVDGDGIPDLIFSTGQTGTVAVFFGLGTGVFDFQRDFDTGLQPMAAAVADFDRDPAHLPDIATVDATTGDVSILLGSGDRQFAGEAILFDSGIPGPVALVAANLDTGDVPDLAVIGGDQGEMAILLGNGDGTFTAAPDGIYPTGAMPRAITAADVNADGRLDLLVSNRNSDEVSVFVNAGNGVFLTAEDFPAGDSPLGIAVGKFNQDNHLDVVVANRDTDSFSFIAGDGAGGFAAPATFAAGILPSDIAAGDFDGDGHLDVAVSNTLSQDVTVAFGNGAGGFGGQRHFLSDAGTSGVLAGRFDQDDLDDLVTFNSLEGSSYAVLLSRPGTGGSFEAAENYPAIGDPTAIAVADINSDGRTDAVISSESESSVALLLSRPGGGFSTGTLPTGGSANGIALADVNGDGRADLLLARSATESAAAVVVWAAGDGLGSFGAMQSLLVGRPLGGLGTADLDEDGYVDIVVTESQARSVGIFFGQAGAVFRDVVHVSLGTTELFPISLLLEDFDRDGHIDIAAANFQDNGIVSVGYGLGDGTFEDRTVLPALRRPLALVASDLDGDGRLDLASVNQDSPTGFLVFRATDDRMFAAPPPFAARFSAGSVPAAVALRDVDGDGLRDAVVADQFADRAVIRLGRGTSSLFGPTESACPFFGCLPAGRTPVAIASADFDGNGTYDILTVNRGGANVTLSLSVLEPVFQRGDANQDERVSAPDLTALIQNLASTGSQSAIEDAVREGNAATAAVDADGDGRLNRTDTFGLIGRFFSRS